MILQKLTKNVGDLGKIIVVKCFEWLPKVQKSPYLVTLVGNINFLLKAHSDLRKTHAFTQ